MDDDGATNESATLSSRRYRFLGTDVHAVDAETIAEVIGGFVDSGGKHIVANHNLHSLYLVGRDERLNAFYERASLTHADGMSVVFIARALGLPFTRQHRVNYTTLTTPLFRMCAERGYRVMLLGAAPGVADQAAKTLKQRFPGLEIRSEHGFFSSAADAPQNRERIQAIRDWDTDLLIVGMGMPKQELWILENFQHIEAHAILNGGGFIDLVAGRLPTPPDWIGQIGMEWLFRLVTAPRRVWFRYLIEPWFVALRFFHAFILVRLLGRPRSER